MERLISFLKKQENNTYEINEEIPLTFTLMGNSVMLRIGEVSMTTTDIYALQDFAEARGREFRLCNHCGKPVRELMMDGGEFYSCEECFPEYMNSLYGEGKWRETEDGEEGENDGYYNALNSDGEWEDTGIFYTNFY